MGLAAAARSTTASAPPAPHNPSSDDSLLDAPPSPSPPPEPHAAPSVPHCKLARSLETPAGARRQAAREGEESEGDTFSEHSETSIWSVSSCTSELDMYLSRQQHEKRVLRRDPRSVQLCSEEENRGQGRRPALRVAASSCSRRALLSAREQPVPKETTSMHSKGQGRTGGARRERVGRNEERPDVNVSLSTSSPASTGAPSPSEPARLHKAASRSLRPQKGTQVSCESSGVRRINVSRGAEAGSGSASDRRKRGLGRGEDCHGHGRRGRSNAVVAQEGGDRMEAKVGGEDTIDRKRIAKRNLDSSQEMGNILAEYAEKVLHLNDASPSPSPSCTPALHCPCNGSAVEERGLESEDGDNGQTLDKTMKSCTGDVGNPIEAILVQIHAALDASKTKKCPSEAPTPLRCPPRDATTVVAADSCQQASGPERDQDVFNNKKQQTPTERSPDALESMRPRLLHEADEYRQDCHAEQARLRIMELQEMSHVNEALSMLRPMSTQGLVSPVLNVGQGSSPERERLVHDIMVLMDMALDASPRSIAAGGGQQTLLAGKAVCGDVVEAEYENASGEGGIQNEVRESEWSTAEDGAGEHRKDVRLDSNECVASAVSQDTNQTPRPVDAAAHAKMQTPVGLGLSEGFEAVQGPAIGLEPGLRDAHSEKLRGVLSRLLQAQLLEMEAHVGEVSAALSHVYLHDPGEQATLSTPGRRCLLHTYCSPLASSPGEEMAVAGLERPEEQGDESTLGLIWSCAKIGDMNKEGGQGGGHAKGAGSEMRLNMGGAEYVFGLGGATGQDEESARCPFQEHLESRRLGGGEALGGEGGGERLARGVGDDVVAVEGEEIKREAQEATAVMLRVLQRAREKDESRGRESSTEEDGTRRLELLGDRSQAVGAEERRGDGKRDVDGENIISRARQLAAEASQASARLLHLVDNRLGDPLEAADSNGFIDDGRGRGRKRMLERREAGPSRAVSPAERGRAGSRSLSSGGETAQEGRRRSKGLPPCAPKPRAKSAPRPVTCPRHDAAGGQRIDRTTGSEGAALEHGPGRKNGALDSEGKMAGGSVGEMKNGNFTAEGILTMLQQGFAILGQGDDLPSADAVLFPEANSF